MEPSVSPKSSDGAGVEAQELLGHDGRVWCVAWSASGRVLASCGVDGIVRVWSEVQDRWVCSAELGSGHTRTVRWVDFSESGDRLASAGFDSRICVWSLSSDEWSLQDTLEGHQSEIKCVRWSPSGEYIASCGRDRRVFVFGVHEDGEFECAAILDEHTQDVKSIQWLPEEDHLLSCSYDNTIRFWLNEEGDWQCHQVLTFHESTVWSMSQSREFGFLASCDHSGVLAVWRNRGDDHYDLLKHWSASPLSVFCVDWSREEERLLAGGRDNHIRLYEYDTQSSPTSPNFLLTLDLPAHRNDVNCVSWNPTRPNVFASCSDDGSIKIWTMPLPPPVESK